MSTDSSPRRALAAALLALAGAASAAEPAPAPNPKTYAIVSLIGDQFSVISHRPSVVGTRLDPNARRDFPVPDPVFDRIAVAAAERALLDKLPGVPVLRAAIRDPRLFALQEKLLEESSESHDMRIALHDVLVKAGATDLLLVTKRKAEASFPVVRGTLNAAGSLAGIGFYLDNETLMYNSEHLMTGEGFLAPFAYVMVSRLDLATMTLGKSRQALESSMSLPVDKKGADLAWDALSSTEKVEALDRVIRRSVGDATAGLMAQ